MLRPTAQLALASLLALGATASLPASSHGRKLDAEQRTALAINRFTFGPRPGEEAQVSREGLDRWFEAQLHPASLDDSALERRLDAYPALRMADAERLRRYPPPATLRRLAHLATADKPSAESLPADPELRAILADQVEFYERDRAKNTPLEQSVGPMDPAEVAAVLALPPAERYAHLLSMQPTELIALRKGLRAPKAGGERRLEEGMTPVQAETVRSLAGTNRMLAPEVEGARLLRDVYSQRQLEAVMTDFWLNHFNVYERKNSEELSLLPGWEKTVRTHALGRFEDLLVATAQSPAMLIYLDNAQSTGPDSRAAGHAKKPEGLNENYARELMELHTLGVNGGYTQHDVTEVAKVFTGWTLNNQGDRATEGIEFNFNANRHEPGPKTVLGHTIAEGGEAEGLEVLHLLATSPATAHFLSLELAQRFVSDAPPPKLVDRMTKTYLKTDGDISAVLRTLFHSPELWTSEVTGAKLKTPLEFVVSAARASGAEVQDPAPLEAALNRLGMGVYGCPTPNGYTWNQGPWLNSNALLARMNFALDLAANHLGGVRVDWSALLPSPAPATLPGQTLATLPGRAPATPDASETALASVLLGEQPGEQTRTAVLAATVAAPPPPSGSPMHPASYTPPKDPTPTVAGLLLGSPEFQRR